MSINVNFFRKRKYKLNLSFKIHWKHSDDPKFVYSIFFMIDCSISESVLYPARLQSMEVMIHVILIKIVLFVLKQS